MRGALLIILCVAGSSFAQEEDAGLTLTPTLSRREWEITGDGGVDAAPLPDPLPADAGRGSATSSLVGAIESRGIRTPVPLAQITFADGGWIAESDGDGRFTAELAAGTHALIIRASGHKPLEIT